MSTERLRLAEPVLRPPKPGIAEMEAGEPPGGLATGCSGPDRGTETCRLPDRPG
nr:hypothetical protein GCM10020093_042650 [Planobispora longispora]